jgi:hypothetical protein
MDREEAKSLIFQTFSRTRISFPGLK